VLDRAKLALLTQAAERAEWAAAADICLDLSLAAKGTPDGFYTETLASAVQMQDPKWLEKVVGELTRNAAD